METSDLDPSQQQSIPSSARVSGTLIRVHCITKAEPNPPLAWNVRCQQQRRIALYASLMHVPPVGPAETYATSHCQVVPKRHAQRRMHNIARVPCTAVYMQILAESIKMARHAHMGLILQLKQWMLHGVQPTYLGRRRAWERTRWADAPCLHVGACCIGPARKYHRDVGNSSPCRRTWSK